MSHELTERIDLDDKRFGLVVNSKNGEVSSDTLFFFHQEGDLVTAEYYFGSIRYGKIIAKQHENNDLEMVYQCLTNDGELKAGSAYAKVSKNKEEKIQLDLNWQWLNGDKSSGTSTYLEIE